MIVRVCRPGELGAGEIETWRRLQEADERLHSPFLSPDFAQAVGAVDRNARVAVIEDGSALIGFFPYSLRHRTIATGLASGISGCTAPIISPEADVDPVRLLKECGLHVWDFADLVANSVFGERLSASRRPAYLVDLADGYERYMSGLTARHKRSAGQWQKQYEMLAAEARELTFSADDRDAGALQELLRWKSSQYRASGLRNPLGRRAVLELVYRLSETSTPNLAGRLSTFRAGGTFVAACFDLQAPTVHAGWFTAYNPRFARYSPGMLLLLQVFQACATEGIPRVDLGAGDASYKAKLATDTIDLHSGHIARRSFPALLRRAQQLPKQHVLSVVRAHPQLEARIRATLRTVGQMRASQPLERVARPSQRTTRAP
jgi:CelD/BcsL family acetyltransferase involved in cellulose biosynthesis